MNQINNERLLAFDIHPQRFGYAVFEGPENLLDCGAKNFRRGVNAVCIPFGPKISQLLSEWRPDIVVLRKPSRGSAAGKMKSILTRVETAHIKFRLLNQAAIENTFLPSRNKYERARVITASLPELTYQLPAKRKPWQPEPYQMTVFDAVALGLTHFRQKANQVHNI
jgi:hypothetical protein